MSRALVTEEAVQKLVGDIKSRPMPSKAAYSWPTPPLNVLDCVLSLNRHYERFAFPRVKAFAARRPEIQTLRGFLELIGSYESPYEFGRAELSYRHEDRMRVLVQVSERLLATGGSGHEPDLIRWAIESRPSDHRDFGVKGFGIAGFQYLRMLLGAETFKPDVHIVKHVVETTGRRCSPELALSLLEAAAQSAGVSAKDLDYAIWLERSGSTAA